MRYLLVALIALALVLLATVQVLVAHPDELEPGYRLVGPSA